MTRTSSYNWKDCAIGVLILLVLFLIVYISICQQPLEDWVYVGPPQENIVLINCSGNIYRYQTGPGRCFNAQPGRKYIVRVSPSGNDRVICIGQPMEGDPK